MTSLLSSSRGARQTVTVIPRQTFLREFAHDYGNGQHVTAIGPTQRGKTTLALEMLGRVVSPQRKTLVLAGKPAGRDRTMAEAGDKLGLRYTAEWPPDDAAIIGKNRARKNGYILRPLTKPSTDPGADESRLREEFKRGMTGAYASQKPLGRPCVLFVDEAQLVQNDLNLKAEYEAPLTRGAPDVAVWSLIQRGRYISYHAYNAPEHLILFYDPDISNVKRYAELIGGVDPAFIARIVTQLKLYRVRSGGTISEALYIKRSGPQLAVIDVR